MGLRSADMPRKEVCAGGNRCCCRLLDAESFCRCRDKGRGERGCGAREDHTGHCGLGYDVSFTDEPPRKDASQLEASCGLGLFEV